MQPIWKAIARNATHREFTQQGGQAAIQATVAKLGPRVIRMPDAITRLSETRPIEPGSAIWNVVACELESERFPCLSAVERHDMCEPDKPLGKPTGCEWCRRSGITDHHWQNTPPLPQPVGHEVGDPICTQAQRSRLYLKRARVAVQRLAQKVADQARRSKLVGTRAEPMNC
jgi:hypothetical protein